MTTVPNGTDTGYGRARPLQALHEDPRTAMDNLLRLTVARGGVSGNAVPASRTLNAKVSGVPPAPSGV